LDWYTITGFVRGICLPEFDSTHLFEEYLMGEEEATRTVRRKIPVAVIENTVAVVA
jgi:hypothetical protein